MRYIQFNQNLATSHQEVDTKESDGPTMPNID